MADQTLPRTPAEARAIGSKFYFNGKPCRYGHVAKRYASERNCHECRVVQGPIYNRANRAAILANRAATRPAILAKKKADRAADPGAHDRWRYGLTGERLAHYRARLAAGRVKNRVKKSQQDKSYRERNRVKMRPKKAADRRQRSLAQRSATPGWANKKAILAFYREAARLTLETGIAHEVDHIIPILSKRVCGLHVETNLQVITKAANQTKLNKF